MWKRSFVVVAAGVIVSGARAQPYKYITVDDFTAGPWEWTLFFGQSKSNNWFGLDQRHCIFGERQVFIDINSNPNNTSLTFSLGNHEQKFTSPLPVMWHYYLEFGNNGTADVDFSGVDQFLLDFYTIPSGTGPDSMTLTVHDSAFHYGTIGWNIRPGGVYFKKSNFQQGIDWKHITYMKLLQDFPALPNPTTYSVTNFYARTKPGLIGPGSSADPLWVFGG